MITTGLVASGGLGAFPKNTVTTAFQQAASENLPENILTPVDSYFGEISDSILGSQIPVTQNPPLDLVGLILGEGDGTPSPTLVVVETLSPTSTPTAVVTASPTLTMTPTQTPTQTASPTSQITPSSTATANCLPPSSIPATTTFFNGSGQTIQVYLVDTSCKLTLYATLGPEESFVQQTLIRQRWWFVDSPTQKFLADYVVSSAVESVDVSTGKITVAPTATPFIGFTVSNAELSDDLTQFGTTITLVPGAEFYVTYDFQVFNDPCPTCVTQLVTGLGTSGTSGGTCAYNGVPGLFPGTSGFEAVTLTAPSTPGTYPVVVEYYWQSGCSDALTNYGTGAAVYRLVIGQIIIVSGSS
ncbi:MAG: hypothetical protein U0V48_03110 [Anaerolineales bacterium]